MGDFKLKDQATTLQASATRPSGVLKIRDVEYNITEGDMNVNGQRFMIDYFGTLMIREHVDCDLFDRTTKYYTVVSTLRKQVVFPNFSTYEKARTFCKETGLNYAFESSQFSG